MAQNLRAYNMTEFFTRGLKLYSFGDIQLKRPVAIKQVLYGFGGIATWSLFWIKVLGLQINPYFLLLAFGPPLLLGYYADKPVYKGETFQELARDIYLYTQEPKGWADFEPTNSSGVTEYHADYEVWISRRRELQLLATWKEEQEGTASLEATTHLTNSRKKVPTS